jgi:bifunctional DNase/RNase
MRMRTVLVWGAVLSLSGCSKAKRNEAPAASVSVPSAVESAAPTKSADAPPEAPKGYVGCHVAGVTRMPNGANAVLLVEDGTKVALPIFIGGTEALSIHLRLGKQKFTRPLTHDLFDSAVGKLGGRVESVRVDKIENNVFLGTVVIASGSGHIELDARPSDAIAIALGNGAPIQVAREVLERAGLDLDKLPPPSPDDGLDEEHPPPVSL